MSTKSTSKSKAKVQKNNFKEVNVAPLKAEQNPLYTASFFSGVRGLDIGAKKAGFQSVFQSDFWEPAGKAFELNIHKPGNINHSEHLHSEGVYVCGPRLGDIGNITFPAIQKYVSDHLSIKISEGQLDVIHGGPPCQGFSKCNTRRTEGALRNTLIFHLLRIVAEAKPKVVLIEQVPDMLSPKFKKTWKRIQLALNNMRDYRWDFKVLNAMNYGARQNRKRLIIMMVRRDLNVFPSFPIGSKPDLNKVAVNKLLPHVHHFSPGQFRDKIKCAHSNIFCTMTATGSENFFGIDGVRRNPTVKERLVLTELEGLILTGIPETSCKKLVGNMVQISFAEALFKHIRTHILKK